MKNRRMLINAVSSLLSYGALLVFSIVSSKYVLVSYGTAVNGLMSSVNQLFSYIALLEAGIGTATLSALYGPLAERDKTAVGRVLAASRRSYRTSAIWYLLCVVAVSFIWPLLIETEIPYPTIFGVMFFHGVSGVITYWFTASVVNCLQADGRNYVNNGVHLIATLATYALKILICLSELNIVFISVSLVAVNLGKCIFYMCYARHKYPEYFTVRTADTSLLRQWTSYLIHEVSGVVFHSTDTILISLFCGLDEAGIYAVYALVITALRTIIRQIFNGTNYVLGNAFTGKLNDYARVHDRYSAMYIGGAFAVYTVAYWLFIPFLKLYTRGITDADYLDPKLALLFVLIELMSSCRHVDGQLIRIAQHARQTVGRSVAEAAINLVVSIIAVQFMGIYGVLLGTAVALFYRANDIIIYANRKIFCRYPVREYILCAANFCLFAALNYVSRFVGIQAETYLRLVLIAIPVSAGIFAAYFLLNFLLFRMSVKTKQTISK